MAVETIWLESGVLWKFSGEVSAADLLNSNRAVYGDSRFDSIRYQILDLLDISSIVVGESDDAIKTIRQVAELDKAAAKTNPHVRVATVASDDTLGVLANLYEAEIAESPWESGFFGEMHEAENWLQRA